MYNYDKYLKYKKKYINIKFGGFNKEDFIIILTVPHSVPNILIKDYRKNDIMALKFTLLLKKLFEDNKYKVEIVESSQSRNICVDNRPQALNNCKEENISTPLWEKLNNIINSTNKKIILIDIHSFPAEKHFDNNDIAFLENKYHTNAIGKKLCTILKKKNIQCNIYESSENKNTIIDKNNERVIYITLVEINEKFYKKEFDGELNVLLSNFYDAIIEILNNYYFKPPA